jgi:hypothetical protein
MLNEILLGLLGFTGGVVVEDVPVSSSASSVPSGGAVGPSAARIPLTAGPGIVNSDESAGIGTSVGTFRLHPCFDLASDAERVNICSLNYLT